MLAEFDLVGTDAVFSTANGATNGNTGAGLYHNSTGMMRPYQSNGTTRVQANTETAPSGSYVCLAMSYDPSTGSYQVAIDSDTWESTGSFTPSTTTAAPDGVFSVFAYAGGGGTNQGHIKAVSMFNEVLSEANLALVREELVTTRGS